MKSCYPGEGKNLSSRKKLSPERDYFIYALKFLDNSFVSKILKAFFTTDKNTL